CARYCTSAICYDLPFDYW
nr:immunoglobulin heavy chain junction region [Macaca mulatta]MOW45738.1 immunoglobulin heavy chain junction region [Macaca mulatta]MOW46360.1 immunoglobulin heavy chain junction region [Macaca mulatta]MOW50365.1 immunoglobulin heavy chain junction region [Macaca mulatta]MOW50790.1 immunoglobulin heavy chain junction region [Macaca mulatta]